MEKKKKKKEVKFYASGIKYTVRFLLYQGHLCITWVHFHDYSTNYLLHGLGFFKDI